MFWAILITMLIAATVVVVWPQYRSTATITPTTIAAAIVVIAVSVGLYMRIGTPDAQQQLATVASVEDMVASLAAKLEKNPDDNEGWKMLGRSYLQMGDMPGAISSFEKAVELEGGNDGETLVALGEAMLMQDRASMAGKAGQLFESGLALAPSSPQGLFFGGLAALQRGDQILAAARWEALLDLNPPEEIRGVLEQRIAEWRGESQPAPQPVAVAAAVVEIDVTLSESAKSALEPTASVFVIARDPAQPSPPVAVTRLQASELPLRVGISDDDAMIPGRVPSAFPELEIIVRVSPSGQPIEQAGDWFGARRIRPAETPIIQIVVDGQVP